MGRQGEKWNWTSEQIFPRWLCLIPVLFAGLQHVIDMANSILLRFRQHPLAVSDITYSSAPPHRDTGVAAKEACPLISLSNSECAVHHVNTLPRETSCL